MIIRHPKKLITKILLYMLLPTLLVLTSFNGILSLFYGNFSMNSAITNAAGETQQVSSRFQEIYTYTLKRFITLTVSDDFRNKVKLFLQTNSTYTECNNLLQDNITNYTHINNLISSVTISRRLSAWETIVYYPYALRLKHDGIEMIRNYPSVSDITFLPSCESPYNGINESIPILIPMRYHESDDLLLIPQNEARNCGRKFLLNDRRGICPAVSIRNPSTISYAYTAVMIRKGFYILPTKRDRFSPCPLLPLNMNESAGKISKIPFPC